MSDFNAYSKELLQASKSFLIEAKADGITLPEAQRCFRASITHAFFFLEAEINYIAAHFKDHPDFDLSERSLLSEKEIRIDKGVFFLSHVDKFFRMEDKIEFLLARFAGHLSKHKGSWFADLRLSIQLRNSIVHPKDVRQIGEDDCKRCILSVLGCISALYRAVFNKEFPLIKLGLDLGPS